uniref:hypothetical protein n=1 Tax=Yersinia ruckeri TaxID=29486 RepID=UPI001CA36D13
PDGSFIHPLLPLEDPKLLISGIWVVPVPTVRFAASPKPRFARGFYKQHSLVICLAVTHSDYFFGEINMLIG